MSSWWREQCPARGAALSHAHWDKCTDAGHPGEDSGHMPFQCCHCRGLDPRARAEAIAPKPQYDPDDNPPLDVQQRLRALGLMPPEVKVEKVSDKDPKVEDHEHREDELIEPRYVTGEGPTGNPYGLGRGELTPRFEARLLSYDRYVQRRGELPGDT